MTVGTRIQVRRDTAADWTTANPTLLAGEIGFETNTGKHKFGDGATAWVSLAYGSPGAGSRGSGLLAGAQGVATVGANFPNNFGPIAAGNTAGIGGSPAMTSCKLVTFSACSQPSLIYANVAEQDVPGANTINVRAALEINGVKVPVFFRGRRTATIEAGALAISDPVGTHISATDTVYVWTWASGNASTSDTFIANIAIGTSTAGAFAGEGANMGVTSGPGLDVTMTARSSLTSSNFKSSFAIAYGAVAIVGTPDAYSTKHVLAVGDSIMQGNDVSSDSGANFFAYGWLQRLLAAAGIPFIDIAELGEAALQFAALSGRVTRMALASSSTTAICNYGINDIAIFGQTAAQIEISQLAVWTLLNSTVGRVLHATMLPHTTSTDNWATAANQTPATGEATRVAVNTWVRAGAPILAGAPVAVGTAGALTAGSTGHPLYGVLETANIVETAQNSGLWKTNGSAQGFTGDGTHPNQAGYALIAAALSTSQII